MCRVHRNYIGNRKRLPTECSNVLCWSDRTSALGKEETARFRAAYCPIRQGALGFEYRSRSPGNYGLLAAFPLLPIPRDQRHTQAARQSDIERICTTQAQTSR